MRVDMDYGNFFLGVKEELGNMGTILANESKPFVTKGVKIIKAAVIKYLPKSDTPDNATNYDGSAYTHMRDDVKAIVKDDSAGTVYGVVTGGKKTAYKWHLVNNGTSTTKATHFVDNAMKDSDSDLNTLADELITKVVQ